jgi:hypothetical protein
MKLSEIIALEVGEKFLYRYPWDTDRTEAVVKWTEFNVEVTEYRDGSKSKFNVFGMAFDLVDGRPGMIRSSFPTPENLELPDYEKR